MFCTVGGILAWRIIILRFGKRYSHDLKNNRAVMPDSFGTLEMWRTAAMSGRLGRPSTPPTLLQIE